MSPHLLSTLQLIRSDNLGPLTFHQLMAQYGTPDKALKELPCLRLKRKIKLASIDHIKKEIDDVHEFGAQFVTVFDDRYPRLLKELPDAPPVVIVKGNEKLLNTSIMGIVGARNASSNGCRLAFKIATHMGQSDWVVASGLARGIDTAAHKGALETGTIAVLAGGINIVYPDENKDLYEKIGETGLLLTEVGFDITPQASHFPRRNRLISGLSQGILVVEASVQSGSLITANYATDQGREVFAIPGSPLDPRCQGSNFLLKQGAVFTESADDILSILQNNRIQHSSGKRKVPFENDLFDSSRNTHIESLDKEKGYKGMEEKLLCALSTHPLSVEWLIQETHLPASQLWPILLNLEIQGKIERHPGDSFARVF